MSTADSAGRPARPSGAARPARQEAATMQRDATRPVPTGREAVPAAGREAAGSGSTAATATKPAPRPASSRRVKLTVARIDPWSAMKMSFLLSVALGIALVVATVVLWTVLDAMGVFDKVNGVIGSVIQDGGTRFDILDFVGFTRVVSLSIVIAVVDVILITAIATLGAFLYNLSSALVGGVHLTLTDD
ncbi:DUF3566 domain-containing protein [Phycicoccus sp. DTK01]|uniref:DUF3566 domain-containing protein n=1 Tax=Phycicoccus sp. DTK01 TaxID=2785745 RepID=UPI001AA775F3|nr:DUF3566 domain-containing protein [Phycicoccus sp. DTK01]GIL34695.1 hypothetical protein PDTK01_07710 [Phycicoccus sp. DTK01]